MSNLAEEIDNFAELLMCNHLLSSVMIVCNEIVEEGSSVCFAKRGNTYEHIGLAEEIKHRMMNDNMGG